MKHQIKQGSFFAYKGDKGVAISRSVPKGWKGRRYPALAPTEELLEKWKAGMLSEDEYTLIYHRDVLSKLNRERVIWDLGKDAVLLCWEITGFCHRHIVLEWLNND